MIAVVDYGAGNISSVQNMLVKLGAKSFIATKPSELVGFERLIIPGVGAYDTGMSNLSQRGLIPALEDFRASGKPILGICLGAQLLGKKSEEGVLPGLGWIDMDVLRFPESANTKIPHMGWREVFSLRQHPLINSLPSEARFYFVHSYFMKPKDQSDAILEANYGTPFVAAVAHKNVMGVQFHPEKSHRFGMALLKSFVEINL